MPAETGSPEFASVFRQAVQLPERDRLWLFDQLKDYLVAAPEDKDSELDRELARRQAALDALDKGAQELRRRGQLGDDAAPTAGQYTAIARELGLPSTASVTRAFGLWRYARAALMGQDGPESAARRRIREETARRRSHYAEPLEGLRLWLKTKPTKLTTGAYSRFVKRYNDSLGAHKAPLLGPFGAVSALALPWDEILAVARGEKTTTEARAEYLERTREEAGSLGLIGVGTVAVLLGQSRPMVHHQQRQGKLPPVQAVIGGDQAWLLDDIEAFRDGRPFPEREEGALQDEVFDSTELAALLGYQPDSLRTAVNQERWHKVPKPVGRLGFARYWLRTDVQAFIAAQDN